MNSLEECCVGLSSSKITERKKNGEYILELLGNKQILNSLNDNNDDCIKWDDVVQSVFTYLQKVFTLN